MPGLPFFSLHQNRGRCLDATSVLVLLTSTLIYARSIQNPYKNDCYDFRALIF
jgi:hypothetical protein